MWKVTANWMDVITMAPINMYKHLCDTLFRWMVQWLTMVFRRNAWYIYPYELYIFEYKNMKFVPFFSVTNSPFTWTSHLKLYFYIIPFKTNIDTSTPLDGELAHTLDATDPRLSFHSHGTTYKTTIMETCQDELNPRIAD